MLGILPFLIFPTNLGIAQGTDVVQRQSQSEAETTLNYKAWLGVTGREQEYCMGTQTLKITRGKDPGSFLMNGSLRLKFDRIVEVTVEQDWNEAWKDGNIAEFTGNSYEKHKIEARYQLGIHTKGSERELIVTGNRRHPIMGPIREDKSYKIAPDSVPASYWFEGLFMSKTKFFGTRTGTPFLVERTQLLGEERVVFGGASINARHYSAHVKEEEGQRDFWYLPTGLLYRARYPVDEDRLVTYELQPSFEAARCG
ncbi:MAG: DUF6134 family protein [Alphaproteobacteria bacterium]